MVEVLILIRDAILAVLLSWVGVDYDREREPDQGKGARDAAVFLVQPMVSTPASFDAPCQKQERYAS